MSENRLAIMQPYFFPYIGYWQLVAICKTFVVYDNVQYSKGGWYNRNKFIVNGDEKLFTIPIKKASDYLQIKDRRLSDTAGDEIDKILRQIKNSYSRAPFYTMIYPIIKEIFLNQEIGLFEYVFNSIKTITELLGLKTEFVVVSQIPIDHSLKKEEKIYAICKELGYNNYVNPIGGVSLYSKEDFRKHGINLHFLKPCLKEYKQFNDLFIPGLSIIDVLMFNDRSSIIEMLKSYELI